MTIGDNRFAELGLNPDDVFVLHPSNRNFLTGSAPIPIFRPTRDSVYGVLLLALGLGFIPFLILLQGAAYIPILGTVLLVTSPFSFFGLFLSYRLWRRRQWFIAAWQNASLVIGQVVTYYQSGGSSPINWLTYQYVSPITSQSVKSTDMYIPGSMEKYHLVEVGTPVIVVVYQKPVSVPAFNSLRRTMSPGFVL